MTNRPGTVARRRALFEEATEIVRREYPLDLELEAVARRIATSRRQLQRAFAESGRTSFRDVLAQVRMRHARQLLADPAIPVRAVAVRVGYPQPAQFAKSFRRHHGTAPSDFRRTRLVGHGGPAPVVTPLVPANGSRPSAEPVFGRQAAAAAS